jgi:hypothetical protein
MMQIFAVLAVFAGDQARASGVPCRCSATELHPQPKLDFLMEEDGRD